MKRIFPDLVKGLCPPETVKDTGPDHRIMCCRVSGPAQKAPQCPPACTDATLSWALRLWERLDRCGGKLQPRNFGVFRADSEFQRQALQAERAVVG